MAVIIARCLQAIRRGRAGRGPGLLRDSRGAAMLEFGFVAVPLIALLLATIETALIAFSQQAIETSTETAARLIMTGQTQKAGTTQQQFHDAACATLPSYLSCSKLIVDVQKATSFSAVNLSAPAITYDSNGNPITSYNIGSGGDIVIVRLMYLWPVSTGPINLSLANAGNGNHLLIGTNVAKTEPFT